MKFGDMKLDMAVYWYGPNGKWAYDRQREDPEACRWVVADELPYGKVGAWAGDVRAVTPELRGRVRATHVKLTRDVPAAYGREATTLTTYAPTGQVIGPYDEIAPKRREIINAERERRDRDKRERQDSYTRATAALTLAEGLGYPNAGTRGSGADLVVSFRLDVFERLIDALDTAYQRGVEAGREAGQWEMAP
jgi:hypothetical protein